MRTPLAIFARLNGSLAPERLTTVRLAVSSVLNRRPHSGHCRRRRIAVPSSLLRESTTRESEFLQNGQFTTVPLFPVSNRRSTCFTPFHQPPVDDSGDKLGMDPSKLWLT